MFVKSLLYRSAIIVGGWSDTMRGPPAKSASSWWGRGRADTCRRKRRLLRSNIWVVVILGHSAALLPRQIDNLPVADELDVRRLVRSDPLDQGHVVAQAQVDVAHGARLHSVDRR